MARRLAFVILMMLAGACSSSDGKGGGGPAATAGLQFVPDDAPSTPHVWLRAKSLTETKLVLEVVGNGVTDLYGVAFRLRYDPAVLAFDSLEASSLWGTPAPLSMGSQKTPGLLLGVVTQQGKAAGLAADDQVLATVALSVLQQTESPVELVAQRSAVVGADGKARAEMSFVGGALVHQ